MAVDGHALIAGLAMRPGSLRLVGLRLVTLVVSSIPALLLARAEITERFGSDPRLVGDGLQSSLLIERVLSDPPAAALLLAALALGFFWLCEQALIATTLAVLGSKDGRARVWWRFWHEGWPRLWAFLRVAGVNLLLAGSGILILSSLATGLSRLGEIEGWSLRTQLVLVPTVIVVLAWSWLVGIGVFGIWCRVLLVVGRQGQVWRVMGRTLRLLKRAPLSAFLAFVVINFGLQGLGLLILLVGAPGRGEWLSSTLAWLAYLAAQSLVWHWLLHAGLQLCRQERFVDLRAPARVAQLEPPEPMAVMIGKEEDE